MLPYRAFVLTCWQEETAEAIPKTWRFRLEEPRTGEQHGFTNLEEVMEFVMASLKESDNAEGDGLSRYK